MAAGYPFDDDDDGDDGGLVAKGRGGDNSAPLSITEISNALKRTVEDRFGFVRLRGEISGFKRAASGHLYMSLKDEGAVLDAVMWKGNAGRLAFRPEDGVEVIATGKLTTYPGRSKYQIVVERMEIAGEGALLALLEKNRQRFEAEGLFANRRALPFAPRTIGVVTSPTGAVIRDILHRLEDRFPVRVLVWPVMVQGQGAAGQVAAAVRGFADLPPHLPRPDLLIVARGGGSIEDLWAFNEEAVVRAVAASPIPVISAVGHETDTTLCDFAADLRAPTPTAAAEIAVPVRRELMAAIDDLAHRQKKCALRPVMLGRERLAARAERLPRLDTMLQTRAQRLDDMAERLRRGLVDTAARGRERLARQRLSPSLLRGRVDTASGQLAAVTPRSAQMTARLARASERLAAVRPAGMAMQRQVDRAAERLALVRAGSVAVERQLSRAAERLAAVRLSPAIVARPLAEARGRLTALERLRLQLDPKAPLQRGYALVCAPGHPVIASREVAARQPVLTLEFADGTLQAVPGERARKPAAPQPAPDSPQPKLL